MKRARCAPSPPARCFSDAARNRRRQHQYRLRHLRWPEEAAQWRAVTQVSRTSDEYAVWLAQLLALEGLSFADLDAAIIASVVPAVVFYLLVLCRKYWKTEPLRIGDPELDIGPRPTVDRPETV